MPGTSDVTDFVDQVAAKARDAAYVAVGLGVLGLQRAQVQRQEMARRAAGMDQHLSGIRAGLEAGGRQVGEWLDSTIQFLESSLEPIEQQLPPQARELAGKARSQLCTLGTQLRQVVAPGD
jgi:recombinational DNA repair ATPase RecF